MKISKRLYSFQHLTLSIILEVRLFDKCKVFQAESKNRFCRIYYIIPKQNITWYICLLHLHTFYNL